MYKYGETDKDGIPFRNFSVETMLHSVFFDDYDLCRGYSDINYSLFENGTITEISLSRAPFGKVEFFTDARFVLDLGTGGASSLTGLAKLYPNISFIGIDRELGGVYSPQENQLPNLLLCRGNWNFTSLKSGTIDRILSVDGPTTWGDYKSMKEFDRVAQKGALLRSTSFRRDLFKYASKLSQLRWRIWVTWESQPDGEDCVLIGQKL